jgi:hypothetical protein
MNNFVLRLERYHNNLAPVTTAPTEGPSSHVSRTADQQGPSGHVSRTADHGHVSPVTSGLEPEKTKSHPPTLSEFTGVVQCVADPELFFPGFGSHSQKVPDPLLNPTFFVYTNDFTVKVSGIS